MNSFDSVLRVAGLALLLLANGVLSASTLVYERQYSHFERGENTLRISLTQQGLMIIERPDFMTRPGRHQFQVDPVHFIQLSAGLNAMPVSSVELQSRYRERLQQQSMFVSHPELSRFQHLDASRNLIDQFEVESIDAQLIQASDEPALQQAKQLEDQWWQLMDSVLDTLSENTDKQLGYEE